MSEEIIFPFLDVIINKHIMCQYYKNNNQAILEKKERDSRQKRFSAYNLDKD
jgi:hypothetical protein